jgi:hypothetical protein
MIFCGAQRLIKMIYSQGGYYELKKEAFVFGFVCLAHHLLLCLYGGCG